MDFQPASQNGITPQSELGTLHSRFGTLISSTSTIYGRPVIIKAISDAAMYKTEPVSFYTEYTTGTTTTNVLLGQSQFIKTEYAVLVTGALGTGTHKIYATWPGEGKYAPVTTQSSPINVNIAAGYPLGAPIVIIPDHPTNTVIAGDATPIRFTASITTGTQLIGNIIFYKDHIEIGTGQLQNAFDGSYKASVIIDNLTSGHHVITATWPGATIGGVNYQGLTTDLDYEILRGRTISTPMTLTLTPSHGIVNEGQITLVAAINTLTSLSGIVYFSVDGSAIYNSPLANNQASITIPNVYSIGDHDFTAIWDGNQSGSPKYIEKTTTSTWTEYARENPGQLTVTTQPPDHNAYAYDTVLVATFSTATDVQGSILFFDQFDAIGSAPIVNNSATFLSHGLSTGTHQIQAYYGGNAVTPKYYSALSSTASLLITEGVEIAAPILIDVTNDSYNGIHNPYIIGETQTITVSISTSTQLSGPVEFYANNQLVGNANWNANIAFTSTVFTSTGTQIVRAHWPGQSINGIFYSTKDSQTASIVILPGYTLIPPITLSVSTATQIIEQPFRITASITTSSAMIGLVTFFENGSAIGTAPWISNTASITTSIAYTGTYTLQGLWNGGYIDNNRLYLSKYSTTASETIVPIVSPSLDITVPVVSLDIPLSISATLTNAFGFDTRQNIVNFNQQGYGLIATGHLSNNILTVTTATSNSVIPSWKRLVYGEFVGGYGFTTATSTTRQIDVVPIPSQPCFVNIYEIGTNPLTQAKTSPTTIKTTSTYTHRFFVSFQNRNINGSAEIVYKDWFNADVYKTIPITNGIGYFDTDIIAWAQGDNPVSVFLNGTTQYNVPLRIFGNNANVGLFAADTVGTATKIKFYITGSWEKAQWFINGGSIPSNTIINGYGSEPGTINFANLSFISPGQLEVSNFTDIQNRPVNVTLDHLDLEGTWTFHPTSTVAIWEDYAYGYLFHKGDRVTAVNYGNGHPYNQRTYWECIQEHVSSLSTKPWQNTTIWRQLYTEFL
jgi:hypothetical protein